MVGMVDVTEIMRRADAGDAHAAEELLPIVYQELRRLAIRKLASEKPGQTLQATALVHEAYLRLVGSQSPQAWNSRGHFFMAAAEAMRRILVEAARRKRSVKQGGALERLTLDEATLSADGPVADVLAVDESLRRLAAHDAAAAKVVELRYFAGMTMPETAEALGMPLRTAERHWTYARVWLRRDLA